MNVLKTNSVTLLFICFFNNVFAQSFVQLKSPDKQNEITFSFEAGGMFYSTSYKKQRIINRSLFSVELKEGVWGNGGVKQVSKKKQLVDETYQLPFGKQSVYTNNYKGLDVVLKNNKGEQAILQMRAYNDGTAFRFLLYRKGLIEVHNEHTQFNTGPDKLLYVQKWDKAYEGFYDPRKLDTIANEQILLFPALLKAGGNTWCLITEAANQDHYPGTQLKKDIQLPAALKTIFPQSTFTVSDSLITPWRTFITGSLATVTESSIVDNLNPPSQIDDMSWITPGVAVFPWWADHFASSNEDVLKKYVDMAAEMKWEWIEFDVALVGTDFHTSRLWETTDWIAGFVQYAHSKNIKVYGWDELKALNTPEKRAYLFGRYKQLGIDGIKIDFLDSDELEVMRFRKEAVADAVKYKMMVSFHGETMPRGLRRTFPNLLTHEGVRGAEYYTFPGYPAPNAVHNTTLPFTRNVVGSMDYTPSTFSAKLKTTSYAHELALPFVFESGWTVMADAPEEYLNSPAKPILQKLEAAWDETKLLEGYPGEYVVMARRKGEEWFIAAINANTERTIKMDIGKMGNILSSIAVYTDGSAPDKLKVEQMKPVNGVVEILLKPNGGFVFSFKK